MTLDDELARLYPHIDEDLVSDLDRVLGIVKSQNQGWGRVCFDVCGIDIHGHPIIKHIDGSIRLKRNKKPA